MPSEAVTLATIYCVFPLNQSEDSLSHQGPSKIRSHIQPRYVMEERLAKGAQLPKVVFQSSHLCIMYYPSTKFGFVMLIVGLARWRGWFVADLQHPRLRVRPCRSR
ncbi:hypothetical protein TNCV_2958881 [Trichonephila clavipes]|nr:hypothetical protein TNCV_2958881 [Trichonephila clavipes]